MIRLINFRYSEVIMIVLEQEVLRLQIDVEGGSFSILPREDGFPAIQNARAGLCLRLDENTIRGLDLDWRQCQVSEFTQNGPQGMLKAVRCLVPAGGEGVECELTFAVSTDYPLALWKMKIINGSSAPIFPDRIEMLNVDIRGSKVHFDKAASPSDMGFYYNGWQSWSSAGWVAGDGRMPRTRLGILQAPMINYAETPPPGKKGQFSSDFFAAVGDRRARKGFVLGFLSQKQHFGSLSADFRVEPKLSLWANGDNARLDPGKSIETDWAVFAPILLDHPDPMGKYFEAVARENDIRVPAEAPVGWCSWYHFYTNLSAQDVRANLKTIVEQQEKLPVQLVQIDDGFETQVGDWFSFKPSFPDGVKPLAQEIAAEGLIPGLWLAPFTVHPKSAVFKTHPEWIMRREDGRPVNAGFGWNALFTSLDLTVPEALQYACNVVRTASHDWGFPYLKLDFLYCPALLGVYRDDTKTRAQVLRMGMQAIRDAVGPDVTLLGCGAPFGPMLGLVDAMRIGPDVCGDWEPHFGKIGLFLKNEPSVPCVRNSIRDILTRAGLHGRWWINDPDCLLIRPDTNLTLAEVRSLATVIGMTGGSLLVSDDLPKLPVERLRIAEVLLPVLGQRARVLDWLDAEMPAKLRLDLSNEAGGWHLLTRFNWTESSSDLAIDPAEYGTGEGEYWVTDFWSGRVTRITKGQKYIAEDIPAHGCALIALRPVLGDEPQYLGSDLHFSMGQELAEWKTSPGKVNFTIRLPRKTHGVLWIHIPWPKFIIKVNGKPAEGVEQHETVLKIPVTVDGFVKVEISKD
jgi:alpha-galactosidase